MKPLETLYIVMPCYNEAAGLTTTIATVSNELQKLISAGRIAADSAMLFCDDGSKDATWAIIEQQHQSNPMVKGGQTCREQRQRICSVCRAHGSQGACGHCHLHGCRLAA